MGNTGAIMPGHSLVGNTLGYRLPGVRVSPVSTSEFNHTSASQAFIHPLVYQQCCTSAYGALVLLNTLQKTLAYGVTMDLLKRGIYHIESATRNGLMPCIDFLTVPLINLCVPRVDILHPYSWNLDIIAIRLYLDIDDNYRLGHGLPPLDSCPNCPGGDCLVRSILCWRIK